MEIYKKLLEARLSISAKKVKKDGTNTFSNYDYFTPVLVAALTSDVCKEFNLLSLFSLKKDEHGYYGELIIVNIDAPKEQIVTQMRTEKPSITATNNAQQMGGCETYTKRYMLMSAFGIADNSLDFDGHDNTKSQPIEKQKFKKEVSEWLSEEGLIEKTKYNIFYLDIHNVERRVLKDLKRTNINAVVCEPFMGPPQRRAMSTKSASELLDEVKKLYVSLFKVLEEVGSAGFKVVLIIPSYKTRDGWLTFNISELIGKKWNVLNRKYISGDLKWERINSIIARNIFILSKR